MKTFAMFRDHFIRRFRFYKDLGDRTLAQLDETQLFWQPNGESNCIAVLVKHLSGNMLSRWTNFLKEDGEKPWRDRDGEFSNTFRTRQEVLDCWEKGWHCLFAALEQIDNENIHYIIYIRNEPYSILDAVLRQLSHYPYHIGQMVYIAKMLQGENWQNLSIPKGQSEEYLRNMETRFPEPEQQNTSPVCFAKDQDIRDEYRET